MVNKWFRKQVTKYLKYAMKQHVKSANDLDKMAREYKLENDQEFLDWQDSLNAISVK